MDCTQTKCFMVLLVCFSLVSAHSASTFISAGIFGSSVSAERKLLQIMKPCPVDFEKQNYTIITSQCKRPSYPVNMCCSAFKQFACPFADELNDSSNDCAKTMFSYIHRYDDYSQGNIFARCREGKNGIECPSQPPLSSLDENNGANRFVMSSKCSIIMLVAFFAFLTIHYV